MVLFGACLSLATSLHKVTHHSRQGACDAPSVVRPRIHLPASIILFAGKACSQLLCKGEEEPLDGIPVAHLRQVTVGKATIDVHNILKEKDDEKTTLHADLCYASARAATQETSYKGALDRTKPSRSSRNCSPPPSPLRLSFSSHSPRSRSSPRCSSRTPQGQSTIPQQPHASFPRPQRPLPRRSLPSTPPRVISRQNDGPEPKEGSGAQEECRRGYKRSEEARGAVFGRWREGEGSAGEWSRNGRREGPEEERAGWQEGCVHTLFSPRTPAVRLQTLGWRRISLLFRRRLSPLNAGTTDPARVLIRASRSRSSATGQEETAQISTRYGCTS